MSQKVRKRVWTMLIIMVILTACGDGQVIISTPIQTEVVVVEPTEIAVPTVTLEMEREAAIIAEPQSAMADEIVQIQVVGLEPGQLVTLTVEMRDDPGRKWTSWAVFVADDIGQVDVAAQVPMTGTYQMADPMGLIWSMAPNVGGDDIPYFANWESDYKVVTLNGVVEGDRFGPVFLERYRVPPAVEETVISENGLVGVFYMPETTEPVSALLVLGGSGGGMDSSKAAALAGHGYATLALDYFGGPTLPDILVEIPLEYFATAIDWLQTQALVDTEKIGVVGTSRGGELALLLGATYPDLKAVISYVGSGVALGGYGSAEAGFSAAWTLAGEPIPFARSLGTIEEGRIPVEKINGPVLLISGKDDQVWPHPELTEFALTRLHEYEHPYPYTHLAYADAGHSISVPYWPTAGNTMVHPVTGQRYSSGGTPAGNAYASADSWMHVLAFLEDAFR